MRVHHPILIAACLLGLATGSAFARGGGGGGPGGMGGGPLSGGASAPHLSPQGARNSNGPNALDRDKGLGRAADRRSAEGSKHFKAGSHQSKPKPHAGKKRRR